MSNYMQTGGNTGLGDYIHLKGENYKNYGIFRKNKSGTRSKSYASAAMHTYSTLKNMIKQNTIKGNVKQIEELLTAVYRQNWNDPVFKKADIDLSNISNQENELAKAVDSQLTTASVEFDRTTMSIKSSSEFQQKGKTLYAGVRESVGTQSIRKSTLKTVIQKLGWQINSINLMIKNGAIDFSKIENVLSDLKKTHSILFQSYQNMIKENKTTMPIRHSDKTLNFFGETLAYANALAKGLGIPTSTEIGITGELGALASLFVIDNKINFTTDDLLSGIVGGVQQGSKNINQTSPLYANFNLDEEKTVEFKTTQDTVDIQMSANNVELFGGNFFGASVKNYSNFNRGITLISGVNLETILGLTGSAFGNHYLNRLVQHEDGVDFTDLGFGNNIVAYALAVRGLSGARYLGFNKLSSYLIAINRSIQWVRVYSTRDILDRLCPSPSQFNYSLVNIEGFPILKGQYLNTYEPAGINVRISKIMAQVRQEKLKMSLSPAFFNI